MSDINQTEQGQLEDVQEAQSAPRTVGEQRLKEDYEMLKDSPDAKRFKAQGGLTTSERKEADEFVETIDQVQAERAQAKTQTRSNSQTQEVSR